MKKRAVQKQKDVVRQVLDDLNEKIGKLEDGDTQQQAFTALL